VIHALAPQPLELKTMTDNPISGWQDLSNPLRRPINPQDGEAFNIAKRIEYFTLIFLSICAFIAMLLPANIFETQTSQAFVGFITQYWPKLNSETHFLDSLSLLKGTKYLFFYFFCTFSVIFIFSIISIPKLYLLLTRDGKKLTKFHRVHCFLNIIFFAGFFYLHFFDSGLIVSSTSRVIGRSELIWFWMALESTVLLTSGQLIFGILIKLRKFQPFH
jgi:hypothetical protein